MRQQQHEMAKKCNSNRSKAFGVPPPRHTTLHRRHTIHRISQHRERNQHTRAVEPLLAAAAAPYSHQHNDSDPCKSRRINSRAKGGKGAAAHTWALAAKTESHYHL